MHKLLAFFLELIKTVAIVFVLAFIIRFFIIQPFIIEGRSMEPNYHDRQLILVDKISYRIHEPKRGDVVVFESPYNPRIYYIKRVIGESGDQVEIKKGDVFVNGSKLNEPYLSDGQRTQVDNSQDDELKKTVGKDQIFVMGDNRDQSSDSREWGLLDNYKISGKLLVVVYPRDNFQAKTVKSDYKFSQLVHPQTFQF